MHDQDAIPDTIGITLPRASLPCAVKCDLAGVSKCFVKFLWEGGCRSALLPVEHSVAPGACLVSGRVVGHQCGLGAHLKSFKQELRTISYAETVYKCHFPESSVLRAIGWLLGIGEGAVKRKTGPRPGNPDSCSRTSGG